MLTKVDRKFPSRTENLCKFREARSEVREWSRGPPKRGKKSWEAIPVGRESMGGPLGGPGKDGSPPERGVRVPSQRARTGWEALEYGLEGSRGPFGEPGGVSREERGWESILEGWEGLVDPSGVPGRVGRARKGWDSHLEGQEGFGGPPRGQEGLGVPPGRLGCVQRPSCWAGKGREALSEVQEWSGGPPEGCMSQEVSHRDGRGQEVPQRAERGREFLPECLDGSKDPLTGPGSVGRPS